MGSLRWAIEKGASGNICRSRRSVDLGDSMRLGVRGLQLQLFSGFWMREYQYRPQYNINLKYFYRKTRSNKLVSCFFVARKETFLSKNTKEINLNISVTLLSIDHCSYIYFSHKR